MPYTQRFWYIKPTGRKELRGPPWSPLARWVYSYCCIAPHRAPHRTGHRTAPLKVSTELTRLYTGFYSALLHLTELNLSSHGFCGSTIGTSGLVLCLRSPLKIFSHLYKSLSFSPHSCWQIKSLLFAAQRKCNFHFIVIVFIKVCRCPTYFLTCKNLA